jgi:hypothetical protein
VMVQRPDQRAEQAMATLRSSVDDVYSIVSKRLLEILFGKHKLMGHLQAMRRWVPRIRAARFCRTRR